MLRYGIRINKARARHPAAAAAARCEPRADESERTDLHALHQSRRPLRVATRKPLTPLNS